MKKQQRTLMFRERLLSRMMELGMSRSELARQCLVDRSTIAQLLNTDDVRLPNAHLAAECASALQVSTDWLLGLTERSETSAGLLSTACEIADAERTPSDDKILEWHREASGYKIRHVPATFPDLLKTEAVLSFEYAQFLDKTPEQASSAMHETLQWLRAPGSDYEICISTHMVESLINGVGYWQGLPLAARKEQIEHLIKSCRELYPSLRVYLCDNKKVYSSPISVFGHFLAVVYIGRYYMVFRERKQIQALTQHFDYLIREADTGARTAANVIEEMAEGLFD
ncbi:helix-turn-helix domain-containing protein [Leucothrix pacifica]|uniref:Transcriptional regulator n=1 Tax=Leucothrix pacifica TaxID=1247513 RepID=A0A317CIM3_9GAMM|nr:helix-turn-helix transcriptional regulator [Leucothrix pacifica]PWQ98031.1 transcriptional regulator [Leucothrix pacifica]